MNRVEKTIRAADRFQQRHSPLAFPVAVIQKFGDDRGGPLTAQLTYTGFFALFPLLLLLTTLLGYTLNHDHGLQRRFLHSALAEFPVLGGQIADAVHPLRVSGLALVVGIGGLLWGARGLTQAAQFAMAEIWNIPGRARPGFWIRQARGAILLLVFAAGLLLTTALTALTSISDHNWEVRLGYLAGSAAVNIALFMFVYRVVTPRQIPLRRLLPGAVLAGAAWQGLLIAGGYLVENHLRHAGQVYGFFGIVIGLLWWIYLGAQLTLICAELNVVQARRLWPRSILQPPLTPQDEQTLTDIAKQAERRPEQRIEVRWTTGRDRRTRR